MTTITNENGLPETIVRAIRNDAYSKGEADYSCTELIDAPRITLLKQRHADEIVEDAADRIWSLLGKLGHKLAEQAGADNALVEERLFADIAGRRISGQSDIGQWVLEDGKITDYKFTSVWTLMIGDRKREWEWQQNIYAWLFRQHGFEIHALEICAVARDWRPSEALQKGTDYPPRAMTIPLTLWPEEEQAAFIEDSLEILKEAEPLPDDALPHCTPEDMWEKPTTWAVMKEGRKSALRVLGSEMEAANWALENGHADPDEGNTYMLHKGISIVERKGRRIRCEDYCPVNRWCSQYHEYTTSKEE